MSSRIKFSKTLILLKEINKNWIIRLYLKKTKFSLIEIYININRIEFKYLLELLKFPLLNSIHNLLLLLPSSLLFFQPSPLLLLLSHPFHLPHLHLMFEAGLIQLSGSILLLLPSPLLFYLRLPPEENKTLINNYQVAFQESLSLAG